MRILCYKFLCYKRLYLYRPYVFPFSCFPTTFLSYSCVFSFNLFCISLFQTDSHVLPSDLNYRSLCSSTTTAECMWLETKMLFPTLEYLIHFYSLILFNCFFLPQSTFQLMIKWREDPSFRCFKAHCIFKASFGWVLSLPLHFLHQSIAVLYKHLSPCLLVL
jgi:hypothetical protein